MIPSSRRSLVLLCSFFLTLAWTAAAEAQPPTFAKAFDLATIGPGSVSTLTFTITNPAGTPVTDLAFTDTLPAAVTIAAPAKAASTCAAGTLSAPDGGTTVTFSGGSLGAGSSCTITVDVTSATPGTHTNLSGDLTSSAGNSGSATADLTVATDRPGFSKSFSPSSVAFGGRSTLTFFVDNTANAFPATSLSFIDNLPAGMTVANPANASTTCGSPPTVVPTLDAAPGSGVISFSYFGTVLFPAVDAEASCTIVVDVAGGAVGMLGNTSGVLAATVGINSRPAGKAAAVLTVTGGASEPLLLLKEFTDDPVPPGGTVTLAFTITNTSRDETATDIAFSDDLDAALSGLVATGLPASDVCDTGSLLSGTDTILLTGGTLGPGASCAFNVTLAVPAGAVPGTYTNSTSLITGEVDGDGVTGSAASDLLFVTAFPLLTKEFTDDPVGAGGTVTLEFTITNTSSTSDATGISFFDEFAPIISSAATLPAPGFCGPGSTASFSPGTDDFLPRLTVSGASLAAAGMVDDSCTFSVTLDVAAGAPGGIYPNTTSEITATVDGGTRTGPPASDDLEVAGAPRLEKEFTDDPTLPGGTATLEFTLSHDDLAAGDATGIAFTDDLGAALGGLTLDALLSDDCGGTLSGLGTTVLSYSGGGLFPGASCTLRVSVTVPAGALPGSYTNTTSDVTATVAGVATTGDPAEDDLRVAGLILIKEFTDDPTIPGDTVNLRFTLDNTSGTADATGISFTDSLSSVLSGLAAVTPLPVSVCGGTLGGTSTFLIFSGGSVAAGASCSFDVTLLVPAGAADGVYLNVTSNVTATVGATPLVLDPAADELTVDSQLLALAKSFTDDPTVPGGTVTLELTVTNLDPARAAAAIDFSDDLGAALPGLTLDAVLLDTCGGTLGGVGTSLLSYSGGNLAAGASCTVRVTLDVPAGPLSGNSVLNTTSTVTGTIDGFAVGGPAASDTLRVFTVTFAKSFDGPTVAGGTALLTFTIDNLDAMAGVSPLVFSDDLDAALPGLAAVGLPLADPCGAGSQLAGTTFLTLTGGSLDPGGSCSFDVTVQLPAAAAPGSYVNTTSDLFVSGLLVAEATTATLEVEPPPAFSKGFAPAAIGVGQVSTLTFTIDNGASALAASGLDFTDNLPAGMAVASPADASTTCSGGTLTAVPGSGVIAYSGGTVADGASCTVQVDITAAATGALLNTSGDLTSSSGNSGPASATLVVNPQPLFTKSFSPDPIAPGGVSTLTFAIDNSGSTVDATGLDFTDNLPAAVTVASPASASTTCLGGTVTAVAGSGVVSYTGGTAGAGTSCTVQADVTAGSVGTHVNVTGALTSSLGSSGTASDDLAVVADVVAFAKSFVSSPVLRGGLVEVEFTVTNLSPAFPLSGITFSDDLGAALTGLAAVGLPAADVCGAGSQLSGTSVLTLTGGNLPPAGSCSFSVTLQVPADAPLGLFTNVTGALSASAGGVPVTAPAASADQEVVFLDFGKAFSPSMVDGGDTTTLVFTITNPDPANGATGITFSDDLDAVVPGLAAIDTPQADVCGAGSQLAGTSVLILTGGSLGPGGSCTFGVTLAVPLSTPAGTVTNLTSLLEAVVAGAAVTGDPAGAAAASLAVGVDVIAIPTLSEWGLLLLVVLLALLALRRLRAGGGLPQGGGRA